jgi:phospho-N-acetylmuramoyl-pentapeptide-transferase
VTHVLFAGVLATLLCVVTGGQFIGFLRARSFGQNIREEGPAGHKTKQGTPTMGGLLILSTALVAYLARSEQTRAGLAAVVVTVACAGIGFLDDYFSIAHKRSLGLSGRWKLLMLVPVAAFLGWMAHDLGVSTKVYVPLLFHVDLGPLWYVLVYLVLAGATNAVNLTDGLDGLAAGTTTIAILAYTAMTTIGYLVSLRTPIPEIIRGDLQRQCSAAAYERHHHTLCLYAERAAHPALARLDLAVFCAALLGACIGFLWYNSFPADVFMGDTGSLGLGGALAALAILTKTELLLPLIGGVFVIEALSVIIQVVFFKRTGRRVFLMAPIHHHFEMKAWSETKIIVRFWIAAAVFAGSGFVLYYLRFDQFI